MSLAKSLAAALLFLPLVSLPHAIGGALPVAVLLGAWVGWIGLAVAHRVPVPASRERSGLLECFVFGALLAACAWIVVQALPWPCGVAGVVAPDLQELFRSSAAVTGVSARCGVSWDPGRTRLEALQGLARLAVFLSAWRLARAGMRRRIVEAVAVGALSISFSGLGHALAGLREVYGIYPPRGAAPPILSPLLNANHYAAASALGSSLALAFALGAREPSRRWGWGLASALAGAMVFVSRSRWGASAFLISVVVLLLSSRRVRRRVLLSGPIALVLGASAVWGLGSSWHAWRVELDEGGFGKLDLFAAAWRHALANGVVGVGKGAFTVSFLQEAGTRWRYAFAEHWPAQWVADWGGPVGGALWLAVILSLVHGLRRRGRSLWHVGGWVAWLGMWLHDLADFSTELMGMGLWSMALWGALLAPSESHASMRREGEEPQGSAPGFSPSLRRGARVAGWLAGGVLLLLWGRIALEGDVREVARRVKRVLAKGEPERALELVRSALRNHPLEPELVLLGASARLVQREETAGRWINLGLRLAPGWAEGRRLAALWLASRGRTDQALLQLAEVARRDPRGLRRGSCPLIRGVDVDDVLRVAPPGDAGVRFVAYLAGCWSKDDARTERFDAWLLARDPSLAAPWVRRAQRRWHRGEAGSAWEALEEALRRDPASEPALRLAVAWARDEERLERTDAWLRRAARVGEGSRATLRLQARLAAARGRPEQMRRLLARLRGAAGGDAAAQADVWRLAARLERLVGAEARALDAWVRAAELSGRREDWRRVHDAAKRLGVHAVAERARRRMRASGAE